MAARDRLVRALRKSDPKRAIHVGKLRRPTVAAWALNAVARAHPDAVERVLDAGERLRAAQEGALRGDASALRAATEARRAAVAEVTSLAADVLGDRAPAQSAAVSATLEAATVDEEIAGLLRDGRLDKERSAAAAGFGFGAVDDWTPPPPAAKPEVRERAARAKADLRAEYDEAAAEAKRAAGALHDAEAEVARLKKDLAGATKAAREARTAANKAELRAETARQRVWEEGERRRQE